MKRILVIIALCSPLLMQAQSIEHILKSIEQNNKELKAQKHAADATKMENRTNNNLPDPTVSYSSFYSNGAEGGHGTEFVASQGFDFPTQYIARNRQATLQNEAVDKQQQAARRDILLNAKNLCLDLILLNQEKTLMDIRMKNADELQALYEKRLTTGDANILEVNKIKMERMNVQTEVAQNSAAHRTALQSLLAMNGNMPLEFAETTYPAIQEINDYNVMRDEVMASDLDLQAAAATARAAEKQVSVDRQGWLPKLEAGFRRNTDDAVSMNGFVVGGSLPLFQNRKKVKIAKAQAISAQLMQESAKDRVEASLMSLFNEMQQLKDAMNAYDVPLMYRSLDLLKQALTEGQISLIEYFVETESIYKNLQAYMQIENQYQKVMANIYKNYNGGGYENSANMLAGLLIPEASRKKVFAVFSDNKGQSYSNDFCVETKGTAGYLKLNSNRIYILTSQSTASSSEVVINSLNPFMDVILIGELTEGKNVGMEMQKNDKYEWIYWPITLRVTNAVNDDYSAGFKPDIEWNEYDLTQNPTDALLPLGDPDEFMLGKAISLITGINRSARSMNTLGIFSKCL